MSAYLLLESIRHIIRTMHDSMQTEKTYWHWIKIQDGFWLKCLTHDSKIMNVLIKNHDA
jgi:hypothetical protein